MASLLSKTQNVLMMGSKQDRQVSRLSTGEECCERSEVDEYEYGSVHMWIEIRGGEQNGGRKGDGPIWQS